MNGYYIECIAYKDMKCILKEYNMLYKYSYGSEVDFSQPTPYALYCTENNNVILSKAIHLTDLAVVSPTI